MTSAFRMKNFDGRLWREKCMDMDSAAVEAMYQHHRNRYIGPPIHQRLSGIHPFRPVGEITGDVLAEIAAELDEGKTA